MTKRNRPIEFAVPDLKALLGGLSPTRFFREYWHKKPLLIRNAVPGLEHVIDGAGLMDLACREEAESRLVRHVRDNWRVKHGPFTAAELAALPRKDWSLLVSGVNLLDGRGDALLNAFNFVPYARLDDLMVSFAPPGGGVGPHFDAYDVFLIQGLGRRRWEISAQDDLEVVDDCPLRILKRFRVDQSWDLEPGDMLYLPPQYAHNGVALTDCMTWSIGFRTPNTQEIATQFLIYLQDTLCLDGVYADPDLRYSRQPGRIPDGMVRGLKDMIRRVRWNDADMDEFIGRYLSEPKPHIFFDPPERPLSAAAFGRRLAAKGARLDPRTLMLYLGDAFYINGERLDAEPGLAPMLRQLADSRTLPAGEADAVAAALLHDWYCSGYLHIGH
ncbi:cupin domain-containing protein [Parasulfuritortus cantonensis]|uniref:Cupin domain-containing protein n=1 Tax=Parasulfuritortus cantonensis TaxID=2528202 RepID=A0A4R1BKP3_9PROT|nr:cupin domain-containing protein [Parasulfuritortus cantonensis]TCJ17904.1 cupin domain-containing protein [Parasulfuritortus cantonensis]